MVRQPEGAIAVLHNRCAHKGTQVVTDASGNAGRLFRCPYHAWTYRLDGTPLGVPLNQQMHGSLGFATAVFPTAIAGAIFQLNK